MAHIYLMIGEIPGCPGERDWGILLGIGHVMLGWTWLDGFIYDDTPA